MGILEKKDSKKQEAEMGGEKEEVFLVFYFILNLINLNFQKLQFQFVRNQSELIFLGNFEPTLKAVI